MASTHTELKSGRPVDHGRPVTAASLVDPAVIAQPNAYYAAMRRDDPVHYDEGIGMWLVSRYEDLMTVLRGARDRQAAREFPPRYTGRGYPLLTDGRHALDRQSADQLLAPALMGKRPRVRGG